MARLREIFGAGVEKVCKVVMDGWRVGYGVLVWENASLFFVCWFCFVLLSCHTKNTHTTHTTQTRLEHKTFKTPTKRTIELTILASAYHQARTRTDQPPPVHACWRVCVATHPPGSSPSHLPHQEINAAEAGSADRYVVQEVIKEIAQSYNPAAAMGGGNSR